ncbi:MAG: DUF4783 domain-containing protein [Bacteroidota bacterium]
MRVMPLALCLTFLLVAGTFTSPAQESPDRRKRDPRTDLVQRRSRILAPNSLRQSQFHTTDSGAGHQLQEIPSGQPYTPEQPAKQDKARSLFDRVREGLATGNLGLFSQSFGSQVQLNLSGGESGTFSGNQAYYVLEKYIGSRKVAHIEFTTYGESSSNPYATGTMAVNTKGSRELAQVYVSLSRAGDRWVITQINIY